MSSNIHIASANFDKKKLNKRHMSSGSREKNASQASSKANINLVNFTKMTESEESILHKTQDQTQNADESCVIIEHGKRTSSYGVDGPMQTYNNLVEKRPKTQ